MMSQRTWGAYYEHKKITAGSLLRSLAGHAPLFDAIVECKPKNILEVGSGTGIMAIFLSWLGYDVTSTDNDKNVLASAEALTKEFGGTCRYETADAFHLSQAYGRHTFDVAFSQGFFEHFSNEDIIKLIREQLCVARTCIFSVPSRWYRIQDFGNERLLTAREWNDILRTFNIVYIREYHKKARGLKSTIKAGLTCPWTLFPLEQNEHLLIKVTS